MSKRWALGLQGPGEGSLTLGQRSWRGRSGELDGLVTWLRLSGYEPGPSVLCSDDPATALSPAEAQRAIAKGFETRATSESWASSPAYSRHPRKSSPSHTGRAQGNGGQSPSASERNPTSVIIALQPFQRVKKRQNKVPKD